MFLRFHPICSIVLLVSTISFSTMCRAETDAYLTIASKQSQTVTINKDIDDPFVVNVTDQHGNPLEGITVWFNIAYCVPSANGIECPETKAYGKFGKTDEATATSDRAGRAKAPDFSAGSLAAQYTVYAVIPPQLINNIPIHPKGAQADFQLTQIASGEDLKAAGLYYDPKRSGEGWQLTFGTSNGKSTIVASWFTYEAGNQMWLSGSADYNGLNETTELPLWRTSGASFGDAFKSTDVKKTPWGSATLSWVDCNHLVVSYLSNDGLAGTLKLERFFFSDSETNCH
jgi:hypothetical protein